MIYILTILTACARLTGLGLYIRGHRRAAARRRVSCGTPFVAQEREMREILARISAARKRSPAP
jgi:hypothetical protein